VEKTDPVVGPPEITLEGKEFWKLKCLTADFSAAMTQMKSTEQLLSFHQAEVESARSRLKENLLEVSAKHKFDATKNFAFDETKETIVVRD